MMQILAVSGSLKADSSNAMLLRVAQAHVPEGVALRIFDGLRDVPAFDPDGEETDAVRAWRRALRESDAVLVACPEYGHSMPGVLKNAIDWVIGTGELEGKVVATTAASSSIERGQRGLAALAVTLEAVSARIVGGAPIARGPAFEADVAALVVALIDAVNAPRVVEPCLDDARWDAIVGDDDPRAALEFLASGADDAEAWEALAPHRDRITQAAFACVPHVVAIHEARKLADEDAYRFVATIESSRGSPGQPDVEPWLAPTYHDAVRVMVERGRKQLQTAQDPALVRGILSVVAIGAGLRRLGRVAIERDEDDER